jgi:hypothetical protein
MMGEGKEKLKLHLSNGNRNKWDAFFDEEWPQHRRESGDAMKKINEMHTAIFAIREDTRHLTKLDNIADNLRSIKDSLIEVVSGKNVVNVETVKDVLNAQQKSYTTTIATMSKIFGMIILILVGMKIFAPQWFN